MEWFHLLIYFVIFLIISRFFWKIIIKWTSPHFRTFRKETKKSKRIIKAFNRGRDKSYKKGAKVVRKKYVKRITRVCWGFASVLNLWRTKSYFDEKTILLINMGKFGKHAIAVKVFFNEDYPYLKVDESNKIDDEIMAEPFTLLLSEFTEEKLKEELKRHYWKLK